MDLNQIPCHEAQFVDPNGVSKTVKIPVVQELSRRKTAFLPERFNRASPEDSTPAPSVPIPVIDMAKIQAGSDREAELHKLAGAAKEWGMFLVRNHGIGSEVLTDLRTVVKGFFELSYEEKKASVGSYANFDNMGYGRNFVQSENQKLDWIDRLGMKAAPKDSTLGLRVWPQNPSNFRPAMEKYVECTRNMCDKLLEHLAESLSADSQAFLKHFDDKDSEINIRVNYYPHCPKPELVTGIVPHTDGSALTVLTQFENSGGLQVYNGRKWISPEWGAGDLLVSIGDLLEIMSNGGFESPWHRVVAQEVERISVAMFYNPPMKTEIEPLQSDNCKINNGGYKKVVVGDYLKHFYKINPSPTKQGIKFAQL